MNFKIIGTGMHVPENIVTNDDLANYVDTNDEWISKRVGIKQRRVSVDETAADMGVKAALNALESSGKTASEIDLILASSVSNENVCPSLACSIQEKIGATCMAYDINAACSAFIFLLETAAGYIERGVAKNILLVGSERMSKIVDWKDRSTCVIFGDGAGAAVISADENGTFSSVFNVHGGDSVIKIPSTSGTSPFYKLEGEKPYLYMNGQETFKFAVNSITSDIETLLEKNNLSKDDVAFFVPHQANKRIIDFAAQRLKTSSDKWYVNIQNYGNTSSASIPIALDEMNKNGLLKAGDNIVLCAFGGGLASAACLLKW